MAQVITAADVTQYLSCPCGLYLHYHGPEDERAEAHAFLEYLRDRGRDHEKRVAAKLPHEAVPDGPLDQRLEATLELMRRGVERIYQPVLAAEDLLGVPDFLEKVDGDSSLGAHFYRPVDVKIVSSPRPEHGAQLALYAKLLEYSQGFLSHDADLILSDDSREPVDLSSAVLALEEMLPDVRATMAGRSHPPTLCTGCGMCIWGDHCLGLLETADDVSLIAGLGPAKNVGLLDLGYADLTSIANADCDSLCSIKGIGPKTANAMIEQARVLLDGSPKTRQLPSFPDGGHELYLDMECQQETQVIYLIGVLDCEGEEEDQFRAFLAQSPADEGRMWREFLAYAEGLPEDVAIYHYHHFEATHLRKLAERHGIDPDLEAKLFDSLVDLHKVLKSSVVLPLYSYGLKPVAKWLGFAWQETKADAAMSMLWFDLWLSTGDQTFLQNSVDYNEDDCRATAVIKEWLGRLSHSGMRGN